MNYIAYNKCINLALILKVVIFSFLFSFGIGFWGNDKAEAANRAIPGGAIPYWNRCWMTVTANAFSNTALRDMNNIKITFDTRLSRPVQREIQSGSQDIIEAYNNATANIIKALVANYDSSNQATHRMEMEQVDSEMAYMRELTSQRIRSEQDGFYSDRNGEGGRVVKDSSSFEYARTLCTREKVFANLGGSQATGESVDNVSIEARSVEQEQANILNSTSKQNQIVTRHLQDYCDDNLHDFGYCKDISNFPLGDILSGSLLSPEGSSPGLNFNSSGGIFQSNYTFSEEEQQVAKDYVDVLIYANPTQKPTGGEMGDLGSSQFRSLYNAKMSGLSLSNLSFQQAIENRIPKATTENGDQVGRFDLYRFQINNTLNADSKIAISEANEKGVMTMIYTEMLLENKLRLELLQQKERIENLTAAINSYQLNSPSLLRRLEEIR